MQITSTQLKIKTKRDDSYELSRFFVLWRGSKKTPLTFLLALTFLFLFSGSVYCGEAEQGTRANVSKLAKSHYDIALAYLELRKNDKAVYELGNAIQLNPSYVEAHYKLGIIFKNNYEYEKAIKKFKTTIQLSPDHSLAHYYLGKSYYNYGYIEKSILEYEKAVQLNPNEAIYYYDLAFAYYFENTSNPKFVEAGKKAFGLDPSLKNIPLSKAFTYLMDHKYSLAIENFEKAIKQNPFDQVPMWALVTTYLKLEKPEDALETIEKIKSNWPKSGFMYLRMAEIANEGKLGAEAITLTKTAIKLFKAKNEYGYAEKSTRLLTEYTAKYSSNGQTFSKTAPSNNGDTNNNAKPSADSLDGFNQLVKFFNKGDSLYSEFMGVLDLSGQVGEVALDYLNGDVSENHLRKKGTILAAKSEMGLNSFKNNLGNLKKPYFKDPTYQQSAEQYIAFLKSLPPILTSQLQLSRNKYEASLSGDINSFNSYDLKGRELIITMLELENSHIKFIKLASGNNDPKYQLYSCIQHLNSALIFLAKARIRENDDLNPVSTVSEKYILMAKDEIGLATGSVEQGKKDVDQWSRKYRSSFSKSLKYSNFFELAIRSFKESYNNELNMIDVIHAFLIDFPSDSNFDQFELLIESLVDKRLKLQTDRNTLFLSLSE